VVGVVEPGPITGRVDDGSGLGVDEGSMGSMIVVVLPGVDEEFIGSTTPTVLGAMRPGRNSNTGRNCRRVRMETLRP
jgi:hypothetical protein